MRDYCPIILCTFLKNTFKYIHVNIYFYFYHSCISAAILKSHNFFVPLVHVYDRGPGCQHSGEVCLILLNILNNKLQEVRNVRNAILSGKETLACCCSEEPVVCPWSILLKPLVCPN